MLVNRDKSFGIALWWRRCVWISLAVLVLSILSLAPYLTSSTELVRLRNALLLIDEQDHGFDWTPDSMPPDFMLERGPADPVFVEAAGFAANLTLRTNGTKQSVSISSKGEIRGVSITMVKS